MYDLSGKVALVSGAGGESSLGRSIACRLARDSADIVVTDLTSNGKNSWPGLSAIVEEIETLGCAALGLTGDVTGSTQVERIVAEASDRFGKIDILVNNAGAAAGRDLVPIVDIKENEFDRVMDMASSLRPANVSIEDYHQVFMKQASSTKPLGRLGTPLDVADAAAWLDSDQSKYITAQAINITGGDELK